MLHHPKTNRASGGNKHACNKAWLNFLIFTLQFTLFLTLILISYLDREKVEKCARGALVTFLITYSLLNMIKKNHVSHTTTY